MDQIFDQFERLFKSWVGQEEGPQYGQRSRKSSGDADFDSAMSELDDFLSASRGDDEAAARERVRRQAAEEEIRRRTVSTSSGPDSRLVEAYRYLGMPFGAPLEAVKAKYKKLLLKHHPDRHSGNPANMKVATETSARINEAWRIIESWATTGKGPD